MDEGKRVLDNSNVSAPWLPAGYKQLSLSPPPVDPTIGQESSLVDPAPSDSNSGIHPQPTIGRGIG